MTPLTGRTVGLVGSLAAFPSRLAQREVARQGGLLRCGAQRGTTIVVFGLKGLERLGPARLAEELASVRRAHRRPMSEAGFLRSLGLLPVVPMGAHSRGELLVRTGLPAGDFDMLALFDAFMCDAEPFSFRDLVLGRMYARLIADGADWPTIVRAVHRVPELGSLTVLSLDLEARSIIERRLGWTGELCGQGRLELDRVAADADALFEAAEDAEASGDVARAAALYNRCLSANPSDAVAAFNRANCLRQLGQDADAAHEYCPRNPPGSGVRRGLVQPRGCRGRPETCCRGPAAPPARRRHRPGLRGCYLQPCKARFRRRRPRQRPALVAALCSA
jgi:Tetratricopeptide repeat